MKFDVIICKLCVVCFCKIDYCSIVLTYKSQLSVNATKISVPSTSIPVGLILARLPYCFGRAYHVAVNSYHLAFT